MYRFTCAVLVMMVLVGCGQAAVTPEPSLAEKQTIVARALSDTPSPTIQSTMQPTKVALKDLDLEPLLIQSGDLPAGFSGAQVKNEAPEMFNKTPKPVYVINQRFAYHEETGGGITVLVYDHLADATEAFQGVRKGMTTDAVPLNDVGEEAFVVAMALTAGDKKIKSTDGLFQRCHAIVHVRFSDISDSDVVEAYLKRLDKRLQPMVCD